MKSKRLLNILKVCFVINYAIASTYLKNERKIEGKVVVVTGAAQGIGFAIADNFLKNGAKVAIILDKNETKGQEAEEKLNLIYGKNKADFIKCDITKDLNKASKMIMKKYGYTDILVNNAGIITGSARKILLTNAIGTIEFTLKYNEYMRNDKKCGKGGTIINIASVVANFIDPFYNAYRGTKFAISGFSQSLGQAYNYKKTGVRVLTICPGPTNTTLGTGLYASGSKMDLAALQRVYSGSILQDPSYVGKGVIEVFKNAESGTSWVVENEKPPYESSKTIKIIKP